MALDWSQLSAVAHQATAGYGGADNAFSLSVNAVDGGYFTIPASMDGQELHYYAQDVDNNQREIGKGIYIAAGRTIARADEDISQSTSGGVRVNFTSAPIVVVDWTGELFASVDSLLNVTGDGTPAGARAALELGTAAVRDAPAAGDAATDEVVLGNDSRLGTVDLSDYYSRTEQDATDGAQDAALTTHKSSGDHDSRYYTKSQQDITDGAQDTAISQNATDILGTVVEVQAGTYIASIDNTDPRRPIINAQEQASSGGGEANVGENLGTGAEVYAGMNALALTLRTMVNTGTVEWTQTATGLSASVPGGVFDAAGSAAAVDSALTTHKSSGDHDARYIQDAPSDGTPYARQDAGWITIPDDGLPAGGTAGQHLAKTSDTSYDTAWVDPESGGGGGLTHQVVTITSSNLSAANGNLYLADVSGIGSGIEFILPAAVAGGSIGLILTTDAPATYGNELAIRANGSIATYLLAKGEEMNFTSDGVSWLFNTSGLHGLTADISLLYPGPQIPQNAWTKVPYDTVAEDSYGYSDIANSKFVPRRSSVLSVYARAGTLQSPADSSTTIAMTDGVTPSIIEAGKQYNDGAANRNLAPYGTVPYIAVRGEDLFVNIYNASPGPLDHSVGATIKLEIKENW